MYSCKNAVHVLTVNRRQSEMTGLTSDYVRNNVTKLQNLVSLADNNVALMRTL